MSKQIENAVMKYGMAFIFSAIGVSGSVVSMVRTDPSWFLILIIIVSFFCMVLIFFSDRIVEFSLKSLWAKLSEVKEIAESAKSIATDAAELAIEAVESSCGSSGMDDGDENYEDLETKAEALRQKIK